MISALSSLSFFNPALLWALAALPVLWVLLRFTPPPPRLLILPTARFLNGLNTDTTPATTPWWILLLRLLALACLIIGLAHPVLHPSQMLSGSGPVRIIIDNGWAATPSWQERMTKARAIIEEAGRNSRPLYIGSTAPAEGKTPPITSGPLTAGEAEAALNNLKPWPWPNDYKAVANLLKSSQSNFETLWLASGLWEPAFETLKSELEAQGTLNILTPSRPSHLAILKESTDPKTPWSITIETLRLNPDAAETHIILHAIGQAGKIIDQQQISLPPGHATQVIDFKIPASAQSGITQFRIDGAAHAGGVFMLPESSRLRDVGIIAPDEKQAADKPFLEARYFLERALQPFANLHQGSIEFLLKSNLSLIIMPDTAAINTETLARLDEWVKDGGTLLRFAGPTMAGAAGSGFLLPVPLREGGRSMGGAVAWKTPLSITHFQESSPLYGLSPSPEITISQQILADPNMPPETQIWATLSDGTPLITAAAHGQGILIFMHTTASPEWTNLPLSGLYVDILRRFAQLSGQRIPEARTTTHSLLKPFLTLDAYGLAQSPPETVKPLAHDVSLPGPFHPPGLYGQTSTQRALNLGPSLPTLKPIPPSDISPASETSANELDFKPALLLTGFVLLCLDWLITLLMASGIFTSRFLKQTTMVIFVLFMFSAPAFADSNAAKFSNGLYLAYIKTGNILLDRETALGLENLSNILKSRTALEPQGAVGVNPLTDDLSFFPFLYWPLSGDEELAGADLTQKLQTYIDQGGTIFFDTRDHAGARTFTGTKAQKSLQNITSGLNIPVLIPLPADHVLKRSFYLLDALNGFQELSPIWLEDPSSTAQRDGVSSVIIGSANYAALWAGMQSDAAAFSQRSAGEEMALRFGVNLVIYALTGNYKADQVHVPYILERLKDKTMAPFTLTPEDQEP
jgi:hypothetical protein